MSLKSPLISVILSAYNNINWLEKTLWSYSYQSNKDFQLIIADDGSDSDVKEFIEKFKNQSAMNIFHIWQEGNGSDKAKILNKAILAATADYILMSEGNCLATSDFVESHLANRQKGYFLSGGHLKLPMDVSKIISREAIKTQQCFYKKWLRAHGLRRSFKTRKLTARGLQAKVLNAVTTTKASWNGANSSGWKSDLLAINGFDERMKFSGQDRELGERLINNGVKSKQIRYSAVCLKLNQPINPDLNDVLDKNLEIRLNSKKENRTYTEFGIKKAH